MSNIDEEERLVGFLGAYQMAKLRKNSHKPGWERDDLHSLADRIEDELKELRRVLDEGETIDIREECADIANFAAMVCWNSQYM